MILEESLMMAEEQSRSYDCLLSGDFEKTPILSQLHFELVFSISNF